MWRIEVTERGGTPLPPLHLDGEELLIGSGEGCQLRLPSRAVRAQHLQLRRLAVRPLRMAWIARHALELDGAARAGGDSGEAGESLVAVIGDYRLHLSEAASSSVAASPQRTESLVRELVRSIMGGAPPRLVVEVGPAIGSSRTLAPPDSRLTVGRGDEADWVILDEELSRVHAALVRTWDGVRVVELGSKNGTRVDGEPVPAGEEGRALRDGARIAFGDVIVRYRDEAETYLRDEPAGEVGAAPSAEGKGGTSPPPGLPSSTPAAPAGRPAAHPSARLSAHPAAPPAGSALVIAIGLAIAAAAIAAAAWLLAG